MIRQLPQGSRYIDWIGPLPILLVLAYKIESRFASFKTGPAEKNNNHLWNNGHVNTLTGMPNPGPLSAIKI